MLRSVGLTQRGFCPDDGLRVHHLRRTALLWGLPASVLVTYGIYRAWPRASPPGFYIPWYSVAIAVGGVFVVVFATMLYATGRSAQRNPIEALKQENL